LPAVADFIFLPFYDLFHENGHVPKIRESLPPLLTGVRRSILEIGAGTGLITTSLTEWTPAEIFALEPSAGMRGILLSRLSAPWNVLERELVTAGFTQTEGAEGLLAWRRACDPRPGQG
jgi:16S rRNA A1518/A1519 N6-dimethyltransferase RsmA/KsgA/DIM1 with predicted DNA glycosylase/AP lyase activity